MLIHEVPEGGYGQVAGELFIHPPGCKAFKVPKEARPYWEFDGTLTMCEPVKATHVSGIVVKVFLIHDQFFTVPTGVT